LLWQPAVGPREAQSRAIPEEHSITDSPAAPRVLVVHRDALLREAIAVVVAAYSGVAEVACVGSAAETLRLTDHGGFGAALVDLGLPKAEIASLVGALRGAGARVVGLAGTDAEAAAGRRAGVDAVGRAERPLAALLAELFPEVDSLPATAPDE
jgi:fructose-1,6-bisphosphatase/inositol monophosphatase family enzyme